MSHVWFLSSDLRCFYLAAKRARHQRSACQRMSDVDFEKFRQDHPRKVAAGHGIVGIAPQLSPGIEGRIADERRQPGHAYAQLAQTRLVSVTKEMRGGCKRATP